MSALELGKRDTGATTSEQKVKSLKVRWFKSDIGKKDEKESTDKKGESIVIQRYSLVKLKVEQGRGKAKLEEIEYFRVICIFNKYYNKWFMIEDEQKEWFENFPKNKLRLMVCMLKSDSIIDSDIFEEVQMNNSVWDNSKIAMVVDASQVISVHGCIADIMF